MRLAAAECTPKIEFSIGNRMKYKNFHFSPEKKNQEPNVNHPRITDLSDHRVMSEDGRQLASKHGVDFFEGSAKEGHGITEAFIQLSRQVLKAQQQHSNQGNLLKGIDNKTVI